MKSFIVGVAVVFLMLSSVSCGKKEKAVEIETSLPSVGNPAPDFTARDMAGNITTLSGNKGKVVMVEFWATWCPPCRDLAADIGELHKKYKDKKFAILALLLEDEGEIKVKSFIKGHEIPYPVFFVRKEVFRQYGISGVPASFIVNKEGIIVNRHFGYSRGLKRELAAEIEKLLESKYIIAHVRIAY